MVEEVMAEANPEPFGELSTSVKAPQITLPDLLAIPDYKRFFSTPPKIHPHWRDPWRVWIQRERDGRWSMRDFPTYAKAHNFLIRGIKAHEIWDGALACNGRPTKRPIVTSGKKPAKTKAGKVLTQVINGKRVPVMVDRRIKLPMPEFHEWCPYCRRPTRWGYYPRGHRVLRKYFGERGAAALAEDGSNLRCRICGVRRSFIDRRFT